jgi:hypothetical protein
MGSTTECHGLNGAVKTLHVERIELLCRSYESQLSEHSRLQNSNICTTIQPKQPGPNFHGKYLHRNGPA